VETATGAGERPLVYLLHGLLGTAYAHFGGQIGAWRDRFRVVPIDLPGHGRCPLDAEEPYLDGAFRYVAALAHRFGPGYVVAASYLGGPLGVRLAREHPELVRSLVLTGFATGMPREVFEARAAGFARLAAQSPELTAEYDRLHGPRWRRTLAFWTADVAAGYEDRVLVRPEQLGALAVDTYLINGSLKSEERGTAAEAARFGPRVRGLVVEGAGHIAGLQEAAAFTAAVEEFWRAGARVPA
jgi:pimeloyl-ACP methyl ester carboxylesterase